MESSINKDITSRLRQNDKEAFNEIYWKYHTVLYRNAFKLTRDAVSAEDIVQEVFCTLWEKRHTLDIEQDIAGWLFVVSYHKSITHLKQKLKESLKRAAIEKDNETSIESETDLSDMKMSLLEKAINQLSPQKRKVFVLCKLQKKTYAEAAGELNISKYTVKEYLSSAVISIKNYIRQSPEYTILFLGFIYLKFFLR